MLPASTARPVPARRGLVPLLLTAALATAFVVATGSPAAAAPLSGDLATLERFLEDLRGDAASHSPPVFASVAGRQLMLPGTVRKIGFHESGDARSLPMSPFGRAEANHNAGRITLPPANGERDTEFLVLPTRYRQGGPTTAVDISMSRGEPVSSPVTGTVTAVHSYLLYGTTPDQIVEITPGGRPDLRVRMLHVDDVKVRPGENVAAGDSIIAGTARLLPFDSQIDRYAGRHPHVHMDVQQQR